MRLWVLGSGSKGNALLVECGGTRLLIDVGFSPEVVARRLDAIGVWPDSIEAVVITHEHGDHVSGATAGAERWGWMLHATTGTAAASAALRETGVRTFDPGTTLSLGEAEVETISVPHDAAEPVALVVTERATGLRAGIAYDLGSVTMEVRGRFRDLDLLVLEANHDEGMLRAGPYPPRVQQRIAGARGHLSNRDAAAFARDCADRRLRVILLAHLSEQCNDRGIAWRAVSAAVTRTAFTGRVEPTMQRAVVGPFGPGASRATAPVQLTLGL